MDIVLKQTIQEIYKGLENGQLRYLINGKSCSGKTRLANKILSLYNKSEKYNAFIVNGSLFNKFFNLTTFNDYKIIKIPIENTKIELDFSSGPPIIHPFPESIAYKNIFQPHKYINKNKNFSFEKNLLIVDDCENVNLEAFNVVDKSLKEIFDKQQLFGGIKMIWIGNSKAETVFDNIFTSALYNNNKNIYKLFKLISINSIKTRFSLLNPNLEYINLNYFMLKEKIKNRSGILQEKDKLFFKNADVEIHRKESINDIYFSNDYDEINAHNRKIIEKSKNKKYLLQPTKLFNDSEVSQDKLDYFYKIYEKVLEPIVLFEGMKVFFICNIDDLDIKRGDIGIVKLINHRNTSDTIIKMDKELKFVVIETNGKLKEIYVKKITNRETGLSFKYLPINIAYCIHFKYLTYLPKANLILTKDININVVESCINKINDIGFKNTNLFNYPKFLEPTYSDFIKNGIKLST